MRLAIVGAIAFFVSSTMIGLLFTAASLYNRTVRISSALDDFLLPAYLIFFAMTIFTVGFLIPTVVAPTWRRLTPIQAMLIAGPLGVTSPVFYLLGLTAGARVLLPLFRSTPWLATVLTYMIPGALLGLIAVLIATVVQRHSALAAQRRNPLDPPSASHALFVSQKRNSDEKMF